MDWAYEVWDTLITALKSKDLHLRAIAGQVLANLAQSDPENRILKCLEALFALTDDERLEKARHRLQWIWKVGLGGPEQRTQLLAQFEKKYQAVADEEAAGLIRLDMIQGLWRLYEQVGDERLRQKAQEWIALETDPQYQKKYAKLWE
ncbi:hypothetical protein MASR2M15_23020 [Anaerolineales bacterium]